MGNDSLIASTTQFQTLLIALVLIVAVIYFFIELRRVDSRISSLETSIKNLINDKEIQMNNIRNQKNDMDVVPNIVKSNVERNIIKQDLEQGLESDLEQDLEPNVEHDLEQGINDELNDYVENQLNKKVIDEINYELREDVNEDVNEDINEELEEVLSNGKKDELEINKESIGISILSYMPMVSNTSDTNEPSNNIEEIIEDSNVEESNDSNVEELGVEAANVEESNVEGLAVEAANVEESNDSNVEESNDSNVEESNDSNVEESNDYNVEELDVKESTVGELDISEPIQEINVNNEETIKDMTIKELKNVLTDMELPTSGNKTKLIQRIVSNQK